MDQVMNVASIKIKHIITDNQMVRAGMDDDHVIELSNSIGKLGLLEPIIVSKTGKDKYQLIAGAHRLAACKRLNWVTIPANIRSEEDNAPVKGLALVENIIRRDMSLKEECDALRILTEQEDMSTSQVCQLLGRSRDWVCKRLAAPNFPDNIRDALFDNLIALSVGEEIAGLEDTGARNYILQEAIYGKRTLSEVRSMVETFRVCPSVTEAVESGLQKAKETQGSKIPKKACEYGGEIVNISDMRLVWCCPNCHSEIMGLRELSKMVHTEGGETYGGNGENRDRQIDEDTGSARLVNSGDRHAGVHAEGDSPKTEDAS